jgi:hypothetical protein
VSGWFLRGKKVRNKLKIWEILSRYWEMLNVVGKNWENGCFVEVLSQTHKFSQIKKLMQKL